MKGRAGRRRGFTLVEVVIASFLMVVVTSAGFGIFWYSSRAFVRSQALNVAEKSAEVAVRNIVAQLRQAMLVTINSGTSITYELPAVGSNGDYSYPPTWDGVTRSIQLSSGHITITAGTNNTTICSGVIGTDPLSSGGTGTYNIFTAGNAGILRSVIVMVVTQFNSQDNLTVTGRFRETVWLRNIPIIEQEP
jgi:prepilin-type N-terminal cleavage/methylation domain-containing protein